VIEQLRLLDDDKPKPVSDGDCQMVIRESRRAKSLILQMLPPYTLEVVVPRGTKPRAVRKFIDENHLWIEKAQSELRALYPAERTAPPTEIAFAAVGTRWDVSYAQGCGRKSRLRSTANSIPSEALDHPVGSPARCATKQRLRAHAENPVRQLLAAR
jgi:predicted metal-dependent hydrolase